MLPGEQAQVDWGRFGHLQISVAQHEQLEASKAAVQKVQDELNTQERDVARAAIRNLPEVVATSKPEWEALRARGELARRSVRRELANQFHEELVRCLARR